MDKKKIILIIASVGTFVEALDIAIINLTIPSIQEELNIGTETAQWLQTLYVLFFGGFLIIGGKFSDQIGSKKIFILGSLIFMLTSLGAGLSSNFYILAIFRSLQGLGAAFIMPSALSIVTKTFKKNQERNRAIAIFSSFAAIGNGSGLSIGGIITTLLSWHWVFLINVPILFINLVLAYKYLPKDNIISKTEKKDTISGIFLVVGLLSITYGTHELVNFNKHSLVVLISLIFGLLMIIAVYYRLKFLSQPLINLNLFRYKSLITSNVTFFSLGAFYIGFLFLISLILQNDLNYSAASAGILLSPFSILSAFVAKFILPVISKKISSLQMSIVGWLFMLIGSAILSLSIYFNNSLILILIGSACISGVGITFCFTGLSVMGIQDIETENYGIASSLGTTSYFLGAGIGLSLITLLTQLFTFSNLSLFILISYALIALIILFFYNSYYRKSK
jgi:EmrB/QacA subfamily drug resistance transporter